MNEQEAMRLLKTLLDNEGAEWAEESGWLRFRVRHGAAEWETACRAQEGGLLLYAAYPFRPADAQKALAACAEIDRTLVRGAMFPAEDGTIVYRCRAELDDVYGAEDRLRSAIAYSAKVMLRFWGQMSHT